MEDVIEGLSRAFCYEFRGDEVRHVVAWKANPEGQVEGKIAYLARSAMAWGREIRLRLYTSSRPSSIHSSSCSRKGVAVTKAYVY